MTKFKNYLLFLLFVLHHTATSAASGEMGTGIPNFGIYTVSTGSAAKVWSLSNATVNFPAGCPSIVLTAETLGTDYKYIMAVLLTAKIAGKRVRMFAHAERDGGCGVDYVEILD